MTKEEIKKLYDDIFYGRVHLCGRCRKKNYNCTNADCLKELERTYGNKKQSNEQMSLW